MPKPRHKQIALDATPYYHCVSRCVRRAFLCGKDKLTGKSFEHRRGWIEERLLYISQLFTVNIAAFAVMSNHYHLILYVDQKKALALSTYEVIHRWHQLFKGSDLSIAYMNQNELSTEQKNTLETLVKKWRNRLSDISWFMRCMNESIARKANQEDDCTGRFWEGRFKSQALLDEKSLLACMVYVDLNPIRSGLADTLGKSNHTSIKLRVDNCTKKFSYNKKIMPFSNESNTPSEAFIPFSFTEYIELFNWTHQNINNKQNSESIKKPKLLKTLNYNGKKWLYVSLHFESKFKTIVGCGIELREAYKKFGIKRIAGISACEQFIGT